MIGAAQVFRYQQVAQFLLVDPHIGDDAAGLEAKEQRFVIHHELDDLAVLVRDPIQVIQTLATVLIFLQQIVRQCHFRAQSISGDARQWPGTILPQGSAVNQIGAHVGGGQFNAVRRLDMGA